MKKILIIVVSILCCSAGFGQTKKEIKQYNKSKKYCSVEIERVGVDGTKFVKAWGFGKKIDDAMEQAKINAVEAVIFDGLEKQNGSAVIPPLCREKNVNMLNSEYFKTFFEDDRYSEFVKSVHSGLPKGANRREVKGGYKVAMYLQIEFDKLRSQLEKEGAIKKMSQGFKE
ncbi:MAG: hypothetical protein IMY73_00015 [Bacteroidetes bacterium]|nr:hypothetical protein [Bacteroidota bacterium]